MGYAGLSSVVRRYNTNDFWSLAHTEGTLPWETTLYVPKILAAAVVMHNPKVFGLDAIVVDPAVEYEMCIRDSFPPAAPMLGSAWPHELPVWREPTEVHASGLPNLSLIHI